MSDENIRRYNKVADFTMEDGTHFNWRITDDSGTYAAKYDNFGDLQTVILEPNPADPSNSKRDIIRGDTDDADSWPLFEKHGWTRQEFNDGQQLSWNLPTYEEHRLATMRSDDPIGYLMEKLTEVYGGDLEVEQLHTDEIGVGIDDYRTTAITRKEGTNTWVAHWQAQDLLPPVQQEYVPDSYHFEINLNTATPQAHHPKKDWKSQKNR